MFKTKQDVDRHVIGIFKNMNSESERNLKCYRIAKHYYAVNDYKTAIKYINRYLSANPNSAAAHKLLGECYIHLNIKAKAFDALKTSLELDGSQRELVLTVCQLLVDPEVPLDLDRATYWLERAESFYPKDPAVFKLKQHILKGGSNSQKNSAQLEKLILAEVSANPTDVNVRIRLLQFFMESKRYEVAYEHAVELEDRKLFYNDLRWYNCLCNLIEEYEKSTENVIVPDLGFDFFLKKVTFLERRADLSMQEFLIDTKYTMDCSSAVFILDQTLATASKLKVPEAEKEFFHEFKRHMGAQLCYHMATLILKRAKKEYGIWQKAVSSASPLLFLACEKTTFVEDSWSNLWLSRNKNQMDSWNKSVALRLSQSGHVLNVWSRDRRNQFLQKVTQFCGGKWRGRVYMDVYYSRNHQQATNTSYFLNNSTFADVPLNFLSEDDLASFDELSQLAYPESLHHLVWLGLVSFKPNGQFKGDFRCKILPDLQFTVDNLFNTGAETLNQLDVDAFLYASVLCAKVFTPSNVNSDKPSLLPVCISEELCTPAQADWWASVYKIYRNKGTENISEIRMKLRKGIETVRVIGQHGLHVKLIVLLAKLFQERASKSKKPDEVTGLETRSYLYWTAAIPLLEKMIKNQELRLVPNRLFDYRGGELTPQEVKNYLEDGRLFLACRLIKLEEHEAAIEELSTLKSPYATFHQGLIYKKLALDVISGRPESITPENRSEYVILLTRARDAFFLTLERLRSPGVDHGHPLDSQIHTHLEEIECRLERIETDSTKNGDGELEDDESKTGIFPVYSDADNSYDMYNNGGTLSAMNDSLPSAARLSFGSRQINVKSESKPSMERLDAHLRYLVETNKNELREIKVAIQQGLMSEFKTLRNEMKGFKTVCNDILSELKKLNCNENTSVTKKQDTLDYSTSENPENTSHNVQQYKNYPSYINSPHIPTCQASNLQYGTRIVPQISNILPADRIPSSIMPNTFFPPQRSLTPADQLLLYQGLGYYAQGTTLPYTDHNTTQFRNIGTSKTSIIENNPTGVDINTVNNVPIMNEPQQQYQLTKDMHPMSVYGSSTIPSSPLVNATSSGAVNKSLPQQAHAFQIPLPAQAILVKTSPLQDRWSNQSEPISTSANIESNLTLATSSAIKDVGANKSYTPPASHKNDNFCIESDADSGFDFKPIIPLPEEVPTVTGEEDETKLFESRAKLLMFVNKNWVERGVGQIKVLHNENAGTARVVMRRENVLTVCANHLISSEMSIQPSKSDESALIWVANDYSDGESVHRQLCVRFKTLDEAKDFEYAFERGREIAKARNENKVSPKKQEPVKHDNSSLECPICKNKYEHGKTICKTCTASVDAEKPKFGGFTWSGATGVKTVTSKSPAKVETSEDTSKPNPFANFTFKIGSSDTVPSEASEKSAFSDTQTIRTGITSFGSLAAAADVGNGFKKDENFKGFEGTGSLVFGYLNQNKGEQENKVELNKTNDEDEGTGHASDFVPTAEFTPVIPLPDLVEVKTGEEEETVLYSERAKILRFVTETKEWKERGIGIMKVLLNEKTGKVRLLMRREQVLKVCCNHFLDEKMKFEPMTKNEKALTWYAQDFSEGDLKVELLALKFGKAESMQSFKKVIEDNQKNMKDGRIIGTKFVEDPKSVENNQKSLSELFKPAPGSWECEACCLRNKAEAIKCAACETRKPGTGTGESGSAKGEPSGITLDPSLMSKFSFGIPQTTVTVTNATTTTSTTTTPNDSFGFFGNFGSKATFDATPKFTFGITQPNNSETSSNDSPTPFGSKDADASNESLVFGRGNLPQELFVESNKICHGQENENVHSSGTKFGLEFPFGSPGAYNFSFSVNKPTNPSSGFAESLSTTTFTTGRKFGKIGSSTGKLIEKEQASSQIITTTSPSQMGTFATSPVKDTTDANTSTLNVSSKSDDSYVESEADPRPDFKPIIPLPEEVPTVTGEEDETKLFESRAKLLMFVNKNWVERGVGQIKVLHNENAGTARVVMRRDQVFKVCANHFILPEMEIVHSKTNDRALIYGANDYSDGESVHRQLCVRFKTLDEAKDFEYAFERGREIAKARNENKVSPKKQEPVKHDNSSLECPICKNKYEHGKTICKTCTASVDAEKPKFGGFTWSGATGVKTVTSKSPAKVETSEDTSKPNPFANFTFKIGSSDTVPSEASEKSAFSDTQTIRTGITSFGSLAAAADVGNGFKKDENFKGFEGTGSLVFGYLNQNKGEQENKVELNKTNDEDEGTGHASDFVPTAEFTPVIPLPDLVEVKTGEEEETVLYSERAKILRFVTETKEWKERGIGIMKVLLNEKTGKVRLLMRREQVLKVCCNHFLDEKMKFEPMTKNEKALTWYAQDFSEGDLKVELLALKFGKAESMQSFKKVIEDNQKNMKDGRIIGTKFVEDPKSVENNQKSLSELFKPAPGSWECEACCLRNKAEAIKCAACETRKPGTGTGESGSAKGEPSGITLDPSLMSKFSFGIPQTTVTVTNATTTTSTTTTPNDSFGFFGNFGSKATFDATPKFTFGIPQSNNSEKSIFGGSLNTFSGTTPLCKPSDSGGEDISIVFEAQASEEQRQKALDLKLPPNFFLYSNAPPCQGCRGCDDEDAEKGDVSNIISSKSETSFAAPIFETPGGWGKQTGSWGTFKFDIGTPKFGSDITFKFGNTTPQISETNIFGKKTERQESDGEADEDEEDDDDYDQDVEDDDEDEDEDEDDGEDKDEEVEEEEEAKDEDEEYVDDEEAKDEDEDDVHEEEVEEDVEEYEQEGEEQDDECSSFEPKLVVEKKNIRVVKTSPFGDSPSKSKTWGGRKKNKSPYFQIYQISPHEYEVHMRSANEEEIIDTKFVPRSESVVKETVRKCIWTLGDTQISIEFQSERDLSDFMELFEGNEGEEDYHSARS